MKQYIRLFKFNMAYINSLFIAAGLSMMVSALFDGVTLSMIMPIADIIFTGKNNYSCLPAWLLKGICQ